MSRLMEGNCAIGVDIGGTNTVFGLVDHTGRELVSGGIPTMSNEPAENLVERLHEAVDREILKVYSNKTILGLGVGAPNANQSRGTVEYPPNFDWTVVDLRGLLQEAFGLRVAVTNDANAAAVGEMTFGAARDMKDFALITLGTGLGSGLVVNGQLVQGHSGFAGEMGHLTVDPAGRLCGCGKRGCLEAYVSATGLCKSALEVLQERDDASEIRDIEPEKLTAKDVAEAAAQGDTIACLTFEKTGEVLGMKLADLVATLSPEAVFLFGGLVNAGELIFEPTRRHMERFLLPIYRGGVKVLPSGLQGQNIAVLGAAAMIFER